MTSHSQSGDTSDNESTTGNTIRSQSQLSLSENVATIRAVSPQEVQSVSVLSRGTASGSTTDLEASHTSLPPSTERATTARSVEHDSNSNISNSGAECASLGEAVIKRAATFERSQVC